MWRRVVVLWLSSVLLIACSADVPVPQPTTLPTALVAPTSTQIPATPTARSARIAPDDRRGDRAHVAAHHRH